MKFDYEISADEYVAAQLLYYKSKRRLKRFKRAGFWILTGALFVFVAWSQQDSGWAPMLLAVTGAWWIYAGWRSLFPGFYFRSFYQGTGLDGEKYTAEISEQGLEITGHVCSWHVRWAGLSFKGESKSVFVLYGANTLFIFGKKYLTDEQQSDLRKLAELPIP